MKLFEMTSNLKDRRDAFWQNTRGPNDTPGVSLHYIQDNEEWNEHLRKEATAKGDDKWLGQIEQKAKREGAGHYHPSFDWWMSKEAYEKGQSGFRGQTKEKIERDNPKLKIHDSGTEAIRAAGYTK